MAVWTLYVYCGAYGDSADAVADYKAVKELHTEAKLIDSYDAAVIERDDRGRVKIVKKYEMTTHVGAWGLRSLAGYGSGLCLVPGCGHRRRTLAWYGRRGSGVWHGRRALRGGHDPWGTSRTSASSSTRVRRAWS
jgi:hypothetical protein